MSYKPSADTEARVRSCKNEIDDAIRDLEPVINSTPTSPARNKLTDANIHLGLARAALQDYHRLIGKA